MQPIVAVPSFICADAFNKFLPFATGFAAGCMIWMVMAEVLPDAFKVTPFVGFYLHYLPNEYKGKKLTEVDFSFPQFTMHGFLFPKRVICGSFCACSD